MDTAQSFTPLCDLGETDNRPALQARIDAMAAAGGGVIALPPARRHYLCSGPLLWRSGVSLRGAGAAHSRLQLAPDSPRPLILLTGVRGADFEDVALVGTGAGRGGTNWASAFHGDGGSADITLRRCRITDWARHGVTLDGLERLEVTGCTVERAYAGGGLVVSRGKPGRGLILRHNRIRQTQFGNIHAWGPVERVTVEGNHLEISGWQGGSYATGDVADNITLYGPAENRDIVIRGNLCLSSAENGIHAAATGLVIEGNIIRAPALYGIVVSHKPYEAPAPCGQVVIAGNAIFCTGLEAGHPDRRGIGLRNCLGFSVTGNQIDGATLGIEVLGMGGTAGAGVIAQNVLTGGGATAFHLKGLTAPLRLRDNICQMQQICDPQAPPEPMADFGPDP